MKFEDFHAYIFTDIVLLSFIYSSYINIQLLKESVHRNGTIDKLIRCMRQLGVNWTKIA